LSGIAAIVLFWLVAGPQASEGMATEYESLIQSIAAENGVFTEEMVERAKCDVVFGGLLRYAANRANFK
jgi:hypothetical protein